MGNLIRYIAQEDPEKELQNEKYSHRNFIESYVPQTPRRQQQTPTPWSKEALRRSTISERPKYTNPNPKPIPTTDIVKSGLEGFGQGIEGGVEYALNSFTRNFYKRINDKFLGGIYKYSNYAIDIGVNGAKAFNLIKKGLSYYKEKKDGIKNK